MSASADDPTTTRRNRPQIMDFRKSNIADGSLHNPSNGQAQRPDEVFGRDKGPVITAEGDPAGNNFVARIRSDTHVAPAAPTSSSAESRLKTIKDLYDRGVISRGEYARKRRRILWKIQVRYPIYG